MAETAKLVIRVEEARREYNEFQKLSEDALETFKIKRSPKEIGKYVYSGSWNKIYDDQYISKSTVGGEDVFVSFRKLERGDINKVEFLTQLKRTKVAIEEKLKELKKNYTDAENALFIHCFKYFEKFSLDSEDSVKGLVARMFINEKEAANLIMGLIKS